MPSLPIELIFEIIDLFRKSSPKYRVKELRFVCRFFKDYIDRTLCRTINVFQNEAHFKVYTRYFSDANLLRALQQNQEILRTPWARSNIRRVQILGLVQPHHSRVAMAVKPNHVLIRMVLREFFDMCPRDQIQDLRFHFSDATLLARSYKIIGFLQNQQRLERLEWNCTMQHLATEREVDVLKGTSYPLMNEMKFYQVSSLADIAFIETLVLSAPNLKRLSIEMIDPTGNPNLLDDVGECNLHYLMKLPFNSGSCSYLHSISLQKANFDHCKNKIPLLLDKLHVENLTQIQLIDCANLTAFLQKAPAAEFKSLRSLHIRSFKDQICYPTTTSHWLEKFITTIPSKLENIFLILGSGIDLSCLIRHLPEVTVLVYDILPPTSELHLQQMSNRRGVETLTKLSPYMEHMKRIKELGVTINYSIFDEHSAQNDKILAPLRGIQTLEALQIRNSRDQSYMWPFSDFWVNMNMHQHSETTFRGLLQMDAERIASHIPAIDYVLLGFHNSQTRLSDITYEEPSDRKYFNRLLPVLYRITKTTGFVSQILPIYDEQGFGLYNRRVDGTLVVNSWDELDLKLPEIGLF